MTHLWNKGGTHLIPLMSFLTRPQAVAVCFGSCVPESLVVPEWLLLGRGSRRACVATTRRSFRDSTRLWEACRTTMEGTTISFFLLEPRLWWPRSLVKDGYSGKASSVSVGHRFWRPLPPAAIQATTPPNWLKVLESKSATASLLHCFFDLPGLAQSMGLI